LWQTPGILADAGMVAPMGEAEDLGYGLAVAADNIRMAEVLAVLERCGDGGECGGMLIHEGVDPLFDAFAETLGSSPANVTLEEFARSEAEELRSSGARARELEAIRSRAGQQC
jgi:hypothetical protein